jgi:acyl carrier protein
LRQDEVLAALAEILGRIAKVDPAEVRPEQTFAADFGIDSVTMVDVGDALDVDDVDLVEYVR